MKLRQYNGYKMYKGQQFQVMFACTSNKRAAELMDCSQYYIKNYFSNGLLTPLCQENPEKVYAKFDSGQLGTKYPDERRKIFTLEEVKAKIDKMKDEQHADDWLYKKMRENN
jgi:hypothetical protein